MSEWLSWLRGLDRSQPAALVSVIASEGSAPRGVGTRMLVMANDMQGTIGGGQLEYRAVEQARAILAHSPGTWRVQDYPLGPLLGQCCGGRVRLLVEHLDSAALGWLDEARGEMLLMTRLDEGGVTRSVDEWGLRDPLPAALSARGDLPCAGFVWHEVIGHKRRPVMLFGAGHVGQSIARHAAGLPLRLAWFDTRPEFGDIAGVTIVDEQNIEQCIADAPPDAAIVILTHDHGLDYRLTLAALQCVPLPFIGLIGSETKRARFLSRLERDGLDAVARARLTCPIGVTGVRGKEPDVIAISTLAQLLQLDAG